MNKVHKNALLEKKSQGDAQRAGTYVLYAGSQSAVPGALSVCPLRTMACSPKFKRTKIKTAEIIHFTTRKSHILITHKNILLRV